MYGLPLLNHKFMTICESLPIEVVDYDYVFSSACFCWSYFFVKRKEF